MSDLFNIKFNSITRSFSGNKILDNIDFTLSPGQVTLLNGDNGTGKTTLLKIISGLLKPDSGFIDFGHGLCNWKRSRKQLIQMLMYMHQTPYMFSGSVYRNLSLTTPDNANGATKNKLIAQALKWGNLSKHRNAEAKTLSGGQQQRVALARAWLRHPPYLLLDEPSASMDSQSAIRTIKLLHHLKDLGVGMVICSHNSQLFSDLVDTRLELVDGQLIVADTYEFSGNVTALDCGKLKSYPEAKHEQPSH